MQYMKPGYLVCGPSAVGEDLVTPLAPLGLVTVVVVATLYIRTGCEPIPLPD